MSLIKVRVRTPARTVVIDIDSRESLGALKKMVRGGGARRAGGLAAADGRGRPRPYALRRTVVAAPNRASHSL